MTREDIIRLAREAGILLGGHPIPVWIADDADLERFAALAAEWGAKQEREACAKVCEDDVRTWSHFGSITRAECAAAIRKRGEVKP